MLARIPTRVRLALAFTVAAALVLAALGVFLDARLADQLDAAAEQSLRERAGDLAQLAAEGTPRLGRSALIRPGDDLAQVLSRDGAVVAGTSGFDRAPLLQPQEIARAAAGDVVQVGRRSVTDGVSGRREEVRLLAARAGSMRVAVVGTSLEDRDEALASLDRVLAVGLPVALLLSALAGFLLAGRALRPVERMRARAEDIRAEHLSERLPVPAAHDELRRLAETLNAMLDRLEEGFERERTFVADAGHELRSPLARLRAELELALRPSRSAAELREALVSAEEEARRLTRLSDDLLMVARAEQGAVPVRAQPVDLAALLDAVRRRSAGEAGERTLALARDREPVVVEADPLRLEQAVGNLVDNALRHGAGTVRIAVRRDVDAVEVHVCDEGDAFPAGFEEQAFARFTRGDTARTGEGAGLGLAIVAGIAAAHGGSAGIRRDAGGTDAWIRLPAAR